MLSSSLYLGGLPPHSFPHPPQMWSATSRAGLVGCIRDLVMNGRSVQLPEVARRRHAHLPVEKFLDAVLRVTIASPAATELQYNTISGNAAGYAHPSRCT